MVLHRFPVDALRIVVTNVAPSPPYLLPSGTNITKRIFLPHLMKPLARCSRYFSSFCRCCVLGYSEKFLRVISFSLSTAALWPSPRLLPETNAFIYITFNMRISARGRVGFSNMLWWVFRGASPLFISTCPLCAAHPATGARSCSAGVYEILDVLLSLCEWVMCFVCVSSFGFPLFCLSALVCC